MRGQIHSKYGLNLFFTSCSNTKTSFFLPAETENMASLVFVILGCKIKIQRKQDPTMSQYAEQMKYRGHEETFFFFQPKVFIITKSNVTFRNCRIWVPDCDLFRSGLKCWCCFLGFVIVSAVFSVNVSTLRHCLAN